MSIASDFEWMAKAVKEPADVTAIASTEEARREMRKLLANIQGNIRAIQDRLGTEFISEF